LEQGRQSGRTGIEVNAILGVNAVYVPTEAVANFEAKQKTPQKTPKNVPKYNKGCPRKSS
jgi:hypothetical protein